MLEEVVVSWQEVRWIWWMRQNFIAQFIRLLKHWLCNVWLGIVVEKSLAHFVDQYQRKALKLSVHLIDLLSILLRCNGFTRIQRAVVDQTSSRPPNSDMTFFWCKFGFGKCFRASSQSNHWAGHCCLLYKIYFSSHVTIYSRNSREDTSKWLFFFFFFAISSWGMHLMSFFSFPICFKCQMTIQWLTLSSSATFLIAVREPASGMTLGWFCQLPMASQPPQPQGSCLLFKTSWTTTAM